jgi:hypothetical protein
VRVVTRLRPKPYGVTRVRDRPHSGGYRNDPSGPLPFSTDDERCVTDPYPWRHRDVSVVNGRKVSAIARSRDPRGGSFGGSQT